MSRHVSSSEVCKVHVCMTSTPQNSGQSPVCPVVGTKKEAVLNRLKIQGDLSAYFAEGPNGDAFGLKCSADFFYK